jgi:hypothetical protein
MRNNTGSHGDTEVKTGECIRPQTQIAFVMITTDRLEEIASADAISAKSRKAKLLLEAMNDWPGRIVELKEYVLDLKRVFGVDKITKASIDSRIKSLSVWRDAWEMESLATILLVFEGDEDLESIIDSFE